MLSEVVPGRVPGYISLKPGSKLLAWRPMNGEWRCCRPTSEFQATGAAIENLH